MIVERRPDEIKAWFLVFFVEGNRPWHRYIPGRFKHVAAFAYSDACRTWIALDFHLTGTRVVLYPGGPQTPDGIAAWTAGASILLAPASETPRWSRFAMYCVPAMAHLVGVGGAVLPDGLWRSCLRAGAKIIFDGKQQHSAGRAGACRLRAGA